MLWKDGEEGKKKKYSVTGVKRQLAVRLNQGHDCYPVTVVHFPFLSL